MGVWLKRHAGIVPYALLAPGILWLLVFYVLPAFQMFISSFWSGTIEQGFTFSFDNYTNYTDALDQFAPFYVRSIVYAAAATLLTFLIAYPLAYAIAFKGGRQKNLLLFLVVAPFFTSFLLRTISWKIILSRRRPAARSAQGHRRLPPDFRLLATPVAVISGHHLQLPAVHDAADLRRPGEGRHPAGRGREGPVRRTVAAGRRHRRRHRGRRPRRGPRRDLRVGRPRGWPSVGAVAGAVIGWFLLSESFVRITFPLSLPGVFAGSLLTFIPAIGDYVNAEFLGNPDTRMIGNVIQNKFLTQNDYPTAAALSFMLMAGVLLVVAVYARVLGTEDVSTGRL